MKSQIILFFLFSFFGSVTINAQDEKPVRQVDELVAQQQQDGEAVDFEMLTRRLETAYKENDLESMIDLKSALLKAMGKRVKRNDEDQNNLSIDQKKSADKLAEILNSIRAHTFGDNQQNDLSAIRKIQQFGQLMKGL